jgi:hypothetical protein
MTADEMIADAEKQALHLYPGNESIDKLIRAAFERGMLQGYIKMLGIELTVAKEHQKNDEEEILNLNRLLIEKDNS